MNFTKLAVFMCNGDNNALYLSPGELQRSFPRKFDRKRIKLLLKFLLGGPQGNFLAALQMLRRVGSSRRILKHPDPKEDAMGKREGMRGTLC